MSTEIIIANILILSIVIPWVIYMLVNTTPLPKDESDNIANFNINHNNEIKSNLETTAVKSNVVLHDWITNDCDFKEQSGLIAVLRGTDVEKGNDKEAKNVTKMLRYIILKDADRKTKFMSPNVIDRHIIINTLIKRYDTNPHWVDHVILAGFIISKRHDCNYARAFWGKVSYDTKEAIRRLKIKEGYYDKYEKLYSNGYM